MNSPQQNLFETTSESEDESYRLARLQVYNWGPFSGLHQVDFDDSGTAIIGPTGSGKTTLVDALMTLLVTQPKYNLASTGGHESDRTLLSYVRGVLGGDGSDGHEEVARAGRTITGICATYVCGQKLLRLGSLLWTDGTSNAAADLKRRWIFSTVDDEAHEQADENAPAQGLEHWLQTLHEDGIRELMKMGREVAGLRIMESKKQYLAQTRKFFDVGENAFTLLNRAAGLKQLNSIDEIFRELVLDDHSAFDRALEVASEFDNLAEIHTELETARRQRDSLIPVEQEEQKRLKQARKTEKFNTLQRIIPTWFAILGQRLWKQKLDQLETDQTQCLAKLKDEQRSEEECRVRADELKEIYLGLGGGLAAQLEETIELKRQIVSDRRKHAGDYQRLVERFGLDTELTAGVLATNQARLREKNDDLAAHRESQHTATLDALSQTRAIQSQQTELEETLRQVKDRPGSNIPPKFHDFRARLAQRLSVDEEDLPYLAEMVEVKSEQSAWRGAIERALGSERLRVLVPESRMKEALAWVNDRDNRIHVRLQSARVPAVVGLVKDPSAQRSLTRSTTTEVNFFRDSFAHKLTFREHPMREAAKRLIAARDLHCVETTEELQRVEHAITIQGMMSGRRGRFEKQDQRRLSDDWLTGFDNKAQLQALLAEHQELSESLKTLGLESSRQQKRLSDLDDQIRAIGQLLSLEFSTIDLDGAEHELQQLQNRLTALLSPDSDASQAKIKFDIENRKLAALRENVNDRRAEIKVMESKTSDCVAKLAEAEERVGPGLNEEEQQLADKQISLPDDIQAAQLDRAERNLVKLVNEQSNKHLIAVAEQEKRLIRCMEAAQRTDSGELADSGSELEDVPHYLQRLAVLQKESLPEKQKRFLEYLNRSSDQGVTQLLAGIDQQVDAIEHRIASLNRTLLKVDFRSGRYLQLQPQRLQDERKRTLDASLRTLRSASLKDDQGESHYKALRVMVGLLRDAADNRRQVGSRALLDPRYRLNFFVVEVDRETGKESPRRTGSQSGSGGEKELMASHILTASLSYALCPAEATRPLYASVILDEAFSKSSPSAATRIIEALQIFGLHPIFVTPNKEISLLRRHTRKVICVQRIGRQSSVASIRWEELEAMAAKRHSP